MPRKSHDSRTKLARKIVDLELELATNSSLTPEDRETMEKEIKHLRQRLYNNINNK